MFHRLTGFEETSPDQVRANLSVDGPTLRSRVNGAAWTFGKLETPTLGELRDRLRSAQHRSAPISVRQIVANVQDLHRDAANAGAMFQVASQFNLLEMVSPDVAPEEGVDIYEEDLTQGPACAIAAGAGTIYRNYFAPVNGRIGQISQNQIDCLADLGALLGNSSGRLWKMSNGYAMPSRDGLSEISRRLGEASEPELDQLRSRLKIGIQWNTQVTLEPANHLVSQAYCSALPIHYCFSSDHWEPFARLILEAAYEATFCSAMVNAKQTGCNKLFLTLLGGGAFGNDIAWITAAIRRSLATYANSGLDVSIVSYGRSKPCVEELIEARYCDHRDSPNHPAVAEAGLRLAAE